MGTIANVLDRTATLDEALAKIDHHTVESARAGNPFFTKDNILYAIDAIRQQFLDPAKLQRWVTSYDLPVADPKTIGVVMAGNIPLVGFHDLLCVVLSGHRALVKLSHKDSVLMRFVIDRWNQLLGEPRIEIAEGLGAADAVIATGSDNSARYFEYEYGNRPHIFRKNRTGVAILTGDETRTQLERLADDVFLYFGLGCRSVSMLLVPVAYDPSRLFDAFNRYEHVLQCVAYRHNLEYQRALHLVKGEAFLTNGFVLLEQNTHLASPISVLHYAHVEDVTLNALLSTHAQRMQCIVGRDTPFGTSQRPQLADYADGIDTMRFLSDL